jgi:hypothetical protein
VSDLTDLLGELAALEPRVVDALAALPRNTPAPISAGDVERDLIVRTHSAILDRIQDLDRRADLLRTNEAVARITLEKELDLLLRVEERLHTAYLSGLTPLAISRCPFTGAVFELAIDVRGFDGMWWRYDCASRPVLPSAPPSFVSLTGAAVVNTTLEVTRHLVMPGPGKPFVLPQLLERSDVLGVISAVPIGMHLGLAIAYFSTSDTLEPIHPDWGRSTFVTRATRPRLLVSQHEQPARYDFDIEPWIARKKLLWVAPEDSELQLRDDVQGCPFRAIDGPRSLQYMQRGEGWSADQP